MIVMRMKIEKGVKRERESEGGGEREGEGGEEKEED